MDPAPEGWACDGNLLYGCADFPTNAYDCAKFGLECIPQIDGARGRAVCGHIVAREHCTDTTKVACNGTVIHACTSDGILLERNCAEYGNLTCVEEPDDQPGDNPTLECGVEGFGFGRALGIVHDKCDGDDLLLGIDSNRVGKPDCVVRVHCKDYGFTSCDGWTCI